jgi:hypothetical protein
MDGGQEPERASKTADGVSITEMIAALARPAPLPGQRHEQARAGVPAEELGTGVAAQIALARRESPARQTQRTA